MQYKTIILQLLEQNPEVYNHLREQHLLLLTLEHYAKELKTSHEAWKEQLSAQRPGRDPSQIASEALELALNELLVNSSLPEFPTDKDEQLLLDRAMAYLQRPTSKG
jgi:hypothetical protein